MSSETHGWKPGPLPPETWYWGGVVLNGDTTGGFILVDVCGNHARVFKSDKPRDEWPRIEANEIAAFNNSLGPVPKELMRGVTHAV